jgi:amino acid adenylation domain-containing protein
VQNRRNASAYPLSNFQKLGGSSRRRHGHAANVVSACFKFGAGIDLARLAQAIALLPAAVGELGCGVVDDGAVLALQPDLFGALASTLVDVSGAADPQAEAARLAAESADRPFSLRGQALARSTLLTLSATEHWWLLSCHTLVADARSCASMLQAVALIYQSLDGAIAPATGWLDQFDYLDSPDYHADAAYWSAQAVREQHGLPLCKAAHAEPARLHTLEHSLPAGWHGRVKALAGALGCAADTLFCAVALVFLQRYSGAGAVSMGWSQARTQVQLLGQRIAIRSENIPLHIALDADAGFGAAAAQVGALLAQARTHARFPHHHLIDIHDSRKDHEQRQFDLCAYYEQAGGAEFGTGPVGRRALPYGSEHGPRLGLVAGECAGTLALRLEFGAAELDPAQAATLLDSAACLLGGLLDAGPALALKDLELVSERQRACLVGQWAGFTNDQVPHICVHQMVERQAALTPHAPALVFEGVSMDYAQLNRRANLLAASLRARGVAPGMLVGMFIERSPAMAVTLLAIMKAGAAFVPLDTDFPDDRLRYIIEDAAMPLIVSEAALQAKLPALAQQRVLLLDEVDWDSSAAAPDMDSAALGILPGGLAYVIYTSGTSGQPKGVLIEHAGVVNLAYGISADLQIDAASRVLQFAALTFDAAICDIVTTFVRGATLYLASQAQRLSPDLLSELVSSGQVSHALLPPVLLKYLTLEKFASVTHLSVGGESTPLATARQWAVGRRLVNLYGPTENTVVATRSLFDGAGLNIGQPLQNLRCYVLDPQERLVPVGAAGELHVGGAGVARGYLNQPDLSASKFVADRYAGHGRMYKTGDVARWLPDGNLEFVGRRDQQVKIRGLRIELEEVEAHIENVAGVRQGAVLVREHDGEKCLVAYIVLDDPQLRVGAIREALALAMPAFMLPAFILILDQFPLTHNRKTDKKKLMDLPLDPWRPLQAA